mmetsp:Transcript_117546/g.234264  ORF Transcript_117546/g.234264 Transcript_117546/m.234264 type:complete len:202 (+) Transcript_117546:309-914(+)
MPRLQRLHLHQGSACAFLTRGYLVTTRRFCFELPRRHFASAWARQVFWPSSPEASSFTVASSGGRWHQNRTRWSLSASIAKSRGMLPAGSGCVGSAPAAARASATARLFPCTDPRSRRDHPSNFSACSSNDNAVEKESLSCGSDLLPSCCGGPWTHSSLLWPVPMDGVEARMERGVCPLLLGMFGSALFSRRSRTMLALQP